MKHQMILMSADLKAVYARLAATRKQEQERRVSSGDRATDSYPVYSGLTPLPGPNVQESE